MLVIIFLQIEGIFRITLIFMRSFFEKNPCGLDGLAIELVDQGSAEWLERSFEDEEVIDMVSGLAREKASDPDGFSKAFFQVCWDIVREDMMNVFLEFHSFMKFEKCIYTSLIALISKKARAMEM